MQRLLEWDHQLFLWLNQDWLIPGMDSLVPFLSKFGWVFAVFLLFIVWNSIKNLKRFGRTVIMLVLVGSAADNLNHFIAKPSFERKRPEFALESVQLRTHSHSSFSFPSSHATTAFAVAQFLVGIVPQFKLLFYTSAAGVAYSRVYSGVHFPSDVFAGAMWGALIGWLGFLLLRKIEKWMFQY